MKRLRFLTVLSLCCVAVLFASLANAGAAGPASLKDLSVLTADEMSQPLAAACPFGGTFPPARYCTPGTAATGCLTTFTAWGTICTGCNAPTTGFSCTPYNGLGPSSVAGNVLVASFACSPATYPWWPCVSSLCWCGSCCGTGPVTNTTCGNFNAQNGTTTGC